MKRRKIGSKVNPTQRQAMQKAALAFQMMINFPVTPAVTYPRGRRS